MAQRLPSLFQQHSNSASVLYSGGTLSFYVTASSTPLAVYSDASLSTSLGTSITLNSAGRPSTDVFLQNLPYKVVLADSLGNTIWTADPVSSSDFASFPITKVYAGNPNGFVAGTAGSAGVLPTMVWDFTDSVLYVCTTTGVAAAAVWVSINASATTSPILTPQGRLTPTSATPVISTEVTAATAVYYTPYTGNLAPIYNGSAFINTAFAELTLSLVASHAINTIYDVFVFLNSGTITVGTGPAWSSSTAGSSSRGTGGGTTQLARLNGMLTNAQSMTARNGSSTYTVAGNYGTYVGSILIDGTAGQISCHNTYGQSRKWGVWNVYNRQPIIMQMGDSTAAWTYTTATIRQSNAAAGNTIAMFCGLQEEPISLRFTQRVVSAGNGTGVTIGFGIDSTTVFSGRTGVTGTIDNTLTKAPDATHVIPGGVLGLSNANSLETGNGTASPSFKGTVTDMLVTAEWRA